MESGSSCLTTLAVWRQKFRASLVYITRINKYLEKEKKERKKRDETD